MAPPSINTQVVIDATNKWLDLWDAVGGNQSVALTEQTYDDIPAVCTALQALVQALGGTWAAATVTVIFTETIPGKIQIHSNQAAQACSILWATGAHGSGALDTHCGTILGYDDAADDVGAYLYKSDWQHQYGWYAVRAIRSYGPLFANHVGGSLRKTLSRKNAKILTIGWEHLYDFVLEALEPWHYLISAATGSNTNRALQHALIQMHQAEWFRVREDQEVAGTYTDFYLEGPRNMHQAVKRRYPDYECYDVSLTFVKKES